MGKYAVNAKMPSGPYVLVTRTVRITSLASLSSYQDEEQRAAGVVPTVDEARNYENDLPFADQCEAIDMGMQSLDAEVDTDRIELTVRVDEASDDYAKEYYRKLGYEVE